MKSLLKFLRTSTSSTTYCLQTTHGSCSLTGINYKWWNMVKHGETFFHATNHVQLMLLIAIQRLSKDMTWHTRFHSYEGHSVQSLQLKWDEIPTCQWMSVAGCLNTPWATVHKVSVEEELVVWRRQASLSAWCFMAISPPIGNNQNKT